MLQITEDTPPDMLAGAMDLTVHLPTGRAVKMAVERSTPMMDLLVQITTNHHLQLSNYTLQALGMAPSSEHSDKILPYKPNTPIGTLDTQHIKVIPKARSLPVPKNVPPGHQPFESTFRLKVHLPRNQLYVTRVSRNVLLENIMKKVCEEKNLDPEKYEFRHPGNLDEVLDPKLTLSDYQITEIYVVSRGASSLNQAFSTSDIMALRKEEERKQMHTKTGGGVFNLIFRRGKSSMGSGSISSDTRSISPTHSDDSRSVTPPAVQPQIITPPKKDQPQERPKPPQRKRRPAPKPPQQNDSKRKVSVEKPPSNISETANEVNELQSKKVENGLTICHSRNSSDSSGYHEASVLSENCSLPRRPKSAFVTGGDLEKMSKQHSQSTTNLSKMSSHSKSTTSLGIPGRKKKAAPPPPPVICSSNSSSIINVEKPSPVVASQPTIIQKDTHYTTQENVATPSNNPVPLPRNKAKAPPKPRPRSEIVSSNKFLRTSTNPQSKVEDENLRKSQKQKQIKEEEMSDKITIAKDSMHSEPQIEIDTEKFIAEEKKPRINKIIIETKVDNECIVNEIIKEELGGIDKNENQVKDNKNIVENSKVAVPKTKETKKDIAKDVLKIDSDSTVNQKPEVKTRQKTKIERNLEKLNELNKLEQDTPKLSKNLTKSMPDISQLQKLTHEDIFSSPEFLNERKPPEVIAMIPKVSKEKKGSPTKFDTFGKRRFQIGTSLLENFDDTASIHSKVSNDSKTGSFTRNNSVNSALEAFNFVDEFSDLDENTFSGSLSKNSKVSNEIFNQLFGMHNFDEIEMHKNQSISSLRSLRSLPGFMNDSRGLKKWNNVEDLDDISLTSVEVKNKWIFSDASDTESILSSNISPARDTLISVSSYQSNSLSTDQIKLEDKSFGSTDSGIAPENQIDKSSDLDVDRPLTPPPPPVLEKETKLSEPILPPSVISETTQGKIEEIKNDDLKSEIVPKRQPVKDIQEPKVEPIKELQISSVNKPVDELIKESTEQLKAPSVGRDLKTDPEISEIDWHYQLPSPPKAFRDSSPAHFNEDESFTGQSVTDFKDSVVTSPELFEKLKAVEDSQSEKGTVTSDLTSVVSEEEKPLLNTLSLENLEKRKSLVYNRELATSLKMTDIIESKSVKTDTFSSSLKQFESTYNEISKSSLPRETGELTYRKVNTSTHTLPNFKISTYDQPKQKIKVFEDDTIRSNTDYFNTNTAETTSFSSSHRKSDGGHSIEVLPVRKSSLDDQSNHSHEEREYKFYKPQVSAMPRSFGPMSSIFRSESFSIDNTWVPAKPVSRSKSQLTLNSNKYKEEKIESSIEDLSRSNSLYDVSGLQSLEVMKLIQNKLSTPTSSVENLNHKEKYSGNSVKSELKTKVAVQPTAVEKPQKPDVPEKIYKYRGPPSINMGTWSERPKIPVSVKEDADYKLGNNVSSKLIVNTTNNNVTSNNSIEVKNNISSTSINSTSYNKGSNVNVSSYDDRGVNNVSIKVNGTEPVSSMQTSGNVVIKIGILSSQNSKSVENQRFINHTTAMGYRKPFSNINKNQPTTRPHSVSYESDFDISRVPVVRSVELKKPYKGSNNNNTSVTQIYQGADSYKSHTLNRTEPVSDLKNKFSTKYRSSENLCNNSYSNHENNLSVGKDPKPIFRVNSYKPSIAPTVRGFKTSNDSANLTSRLSWNSPASYNTLPAKSKEKEGYTTNKDVPFSQSNLRRTESSKLVDRNGHNIEYNPNNYVEIHNEKNSTYNSLPSVTKSDIIKPPPPPSMPKANVKKSLSKPIGAEVDSRDQLLSAIRNFGGKKGLKAVKA
ncbi:MATH and LRR domain-containing protein PFE0570w isoform X2 [Anoplophora glabripennis]|nr:MATH and LRR domain-containing protein PFE0570w isoform X2 [Anoplophora glabripennis]XP_018565527.1 MATH and LRR domain-containing protein PFE0570w isoform X2 [Anoplophora glabripennis]XP_023311403.1 MATH and LRR domain-containing protein PFE0570w isoform X2 [Anoplophora glabripennis]